jgi:queuine tRNA-ribosyltransferase
MAFDECTPYPCDYRYAQRSWNDTPLVRPMCESFDKVPKNMVTTKPFFPIVQEVVIWLRQKSAYANSNQVKRNWRTFSRGTCGGNVCHDRKIVCEILQKTNRYLMGVGT